jgi:NRAMP (natural resistance-associated macrophage protein)-like metal ion transporter
MSIAFVDPGNLESDLQTGATAGYTLNWLVVWATLLGFLVQLVSLRLGVVTQMHLAQHCRMVYPAVRAVADRQHCVREQIRTCVSALPLRCPARA